MIRPRDAFYMERALALATRGLGRTHPNPPVGAVVVRGGRIVGAGFHRRAGEAHAEVLALRRAGRRALGATLYVTLEPCVHHGRTAPCVDAVLRAGIARVVVGIVDPDPRVSGRGIRRLRRAGLGVDTGVGAGAGRRLLRGYLQRLARGRPFVVLKLAASLDGRIATVAGASRWITGPAARRRAHQFRDQCDGVMVGIGTARVDDPRLTCRIAGGRDPIRIVVDARLELSPGARMLRARSTAPTWVITTRAASPRREARLRRVGAVVIRLPGRARVDLISLFGELGRRGLTTVLIEGGGELAAAALRARRVDQVSMFLAPRIIGGDGVPAVGSLGVGRLEEALRLGALRVERLGPDLLVEATLPSGGVAL